jgi:hypothetical protein
MALARSRTPVVAMAIAAISIQFVGEPANAQTAGPDQQGNSICLMLESAARANDLPVEFFVRLIWQESRFRTDAVGPPTRSGQAQGIAQFMTETAAERGLLDPFDPVQALPRAAEYLRELHDRFGNYGLAAAAYNAGPRRVAEWLAGTGHMPDETRRYVAAITGRSVDDWASSARQDGRPPVALACDRLIALMKEQPTTFLTALGERVTADSSQAWGVQLAAGFSRDKVLEKYAQAVKRLSNDVATRDPIVRSVVWRSRGTTPFYQVRIGVETRTQADGLCRQIRAAAGDCMVLRNRS